MKKIKQQKIVYYNKKSMNTCVHIKSTKRLLIGQDGVTYKNCNNKLMLQKILAQNNLSIQLLTYIQQSVSVRIYVHRIGTLNLKKNLNKTILGVYVEDYVMKN